MAKGINKVILIGNLGSDPQIRYTPVGNAVANIRLATTNIWKDRNDILQEKTEWHQIVLFNRRAEIAAKYLKKGSKIYIEGSLHSRKWQDSEGLDRYSTEVIANDLQFLSMKQANGDNLNANDDYLTENDDLEAEQSDEEFFKA